MSTDPDGTIEPGVETTAGDTIAGGPVGDATAADPTAVNPEPETAPPAEADEFVDTPENIEVSDDTDDSDADDSVGEAPAGVAGSAGSEAAAGPATRKSSRKAALEAEGDVAADFLEALLDICDIDGDIDVDIDGDRAAVSIVDSEEGRVPRRLVGPDGKVLEALQELTRLAVQTETGERSRLMLDVAGHRAARKAEIVEIARGVIEDVKSSGDQVEMDPMTAFERKIVHDQVLAAGLRSESDGVEPRRFVVVLPAG